jgi:two-component system, OmpR family, response regulator
MASLLVVEDDRDLRSLLVLRLTRSGHAVIAASCGREAIDAAETCGELDAAVLDTALPDASGFAVLRVLRSRHPRLPVTFLSAVREWGARERAAAVGAAFIARPFANADLLTVVQGLLKAPDGRPRGERQRSRTP